jgi:hypothetical protein
MYLENAARDPQQARIIIGNQTLSNTQEHTNLVKDDFQIVDSQEPPPNK